MSTNEGVEVVEDELPEGDRPVVKASDPSIRERWEEGTVQEKLDLLRTFYDPTAWGPEEGYAGTGLPLGAFIAPIESVEGSPPPASPPADDQPSQEVPAPVPPVPPPPPRRHRARTSHAFDRGAFGRRVAYLRGRQEMTQRGLAEGIGASRHVVNQLEQGHRETTVGELVALAEVLKAPVGFLVGQVGVGTAPGTADGAHGRLKLQPEFTDALLDLLYDLPKEYVPILLAEMIAYGQFRAVLERKGGGKRGGTRGNKVNPAADHSGTDTNQDTIAGVEA